MHRSLLHGLAAGLVVLLGTQSVLATCGGGGGGGGGGMGASAGASEQVYNVPWQVAENEAAPAEGLVLYWFPASAEEVKISALRTSRTLALYSGQCVARLDSMRWRFVFAMDQLRLSFSGRRTRFALSSPHCPSRCPA